MLACNSDANIDVAGISKGAVQRPCAPVQITQRAAIMEAA